MKIIEYIGRIVHPVGSIYCTEKAVNPGDFWGGTWEQWSGTMLLGAGSSYAVNATGGYRDAAVISHTHPAGSHTHETYRTQANGTNWNICGYKISSGCGIARIIHNGNGAEVMITAKATSSDLAWSGEKLAAANITVASSGSSGVGANMPPFKNVYMWHRIS
ncbi:MAG: hypothetical protein Q4B18_02620 [Bacillota bacterium]|nr:hypothetical protein [Bacillota bacterium]